MTVTKLDQLFHDYCKSTMRGETSANIGADFQKPAVLPCDSTSMWFSSSAMCNGDVRKSVQAWLLLAPISINKLVTSTLPLFTACCCQNLISTSKRTFVGTTCVCWMKLVLLKFWQQAVQYFDVAKLRCHVWWQTLASCGLVLLSASFKQQALYFDVARPRCHMQWWCTFIATSILDQIPSAAWQA